MEAHLFVEHQAGIVSLSGALTAERVSDVRDVLLAQLARERTLAVDLSGVHAIDARGAELLMHLHHEALIAHKALTLFGATHAVCEQLDGMNLGRALSIGAPRNWS
jgi:ABC-type transporter Mla MlaB component